METSKVEEAVNVFLTDYCRIFQVNEIALQETHKRLEKNLLCSCIFLQQFLEQEQSPGEEKGNYQEISNALAKFVKTETENEKEYCVLRRWFPSVTGRKSSFLEFARLLWVEQHYFEEEERRTFEDVILNVWVRFHDAQHMTLSEEEKQKWTEMFGGDNSQPPNADTIGNRAIACLKELLEEYYTHLYLGKRLYDAGFDRERILEDWQICVRYMMQENGMNVAKKEEQGNNAELG